MNCALALRMLDAYVDDELDAATAAEMAAHLQSCSACAAMHEERVAMQTALRTSSLREAAPKGLRASILREIQNVQAPGAPARTVQWWQAWVVGASMAMAGAVGGWWLAQPRLIDSSPDLVVARHVASLAPAGPRIDVASSDRHEVRPWFQGRLDFAPRVRDLSAQGIDLVGGRVEQIGDRQAAAIVYRLHKHVINVFVWRGTGEPAVTARDATVRGFNVVTWSEQDLNFAAVSDTDSAELKRFTEAYRSPQ
jgi:anti-sigma factor (TIGR02949 family)